MAPDFPIARFQLGQMCLVRGNVAGAKAILAPLTELPTSMALSNYAKGLIGAADENAGDAICRLQAMDITYIYFCRARRNSHQAYPVIKRCAS